MRVCVCVCGCVCFSVFWLVGTQEQEKQELSSTYVTATLDRNDCSSYLQLQVRTPNSNVSKICHVVFVFALIPTMFVCLLFFREGGVARMCTPWVVSTAYNYHLQEYLKMLLTCKEVCFGEKHERVDVRRHNIGDTQHGRGPARAEKGQHNSRQGPNGHGPRRPQKKGQNFVLVVL